MKRIWIALAAMALLIAHDHLPKDPIPINLARDCPPAQVRYAGLVPTADCASETVQTAVDVSVWPESVEVAPSSDVQFYAGVLRDDGSTECTVPPEAPGAIYDSGTFAGGCDSAIALLDLSLVPQDTTQRALQFTWGSQAGAGREIVEGADTSFVAYDSIAYQVSIAGALDTTLADTTLVWAGGTPDSSYTVRARAFGFLDALIDSTAFGDSVVVVFPPVVVTTSTLLPVEMLADTVSQ